jgi:nucleoside-diphosphate-sugar epimerase
VVRDASLEVMMRIFVAGGSGTIGLPLVRALVEAGHQVTALTRSKDKQQMLRALGASPATADALDSNALDAAVRAARPTHVIHQLTALPKDGVRRASDLAPTNRLRIEGTRNLLDAAIAAGARRFVGGSFAPLHGIGPDAPANVREGAAAIESMESQILGASQSDRIEGIVLRYGLFYGPGNPATEKMMALVRRRMLPVVRGDRSLLPCIHMADAVSATVAALDHGPAGTAYDIVDDRPVSMTEIVRTLAEYAGAPPPFTVPAWLPRLLAPYMAAVTSMRLTLSNEKARTELDWRPAFPTVREGLAEMSARAA